VEEAVATQLPSQFKFSIGVKETNGAEVERIALAVSTPGTPQYGQHLTSAHLLEMTEPTATDAAAVRAWIGTEAECDTLVESTSRLVTLSCSAEGAGRLLSTGFRTLVNTKTNQRAVRATGYTLPASVEAAVSGIFGLHGLPLPPRASSRPQWNQPIQADATAPAGQPANVTPAVINQVYKVKGVTVDREGANKQAVAEFQGLTPEPF
jgi:tripeptidyl-peptidase-1